MLRPFGVVKIEGTEGAASPFFSADGEGIAFFTALGLKTVPLGDAVAVPRGAVHSAGVGRGRIGKVCP